MTGNSTGSGKDGQRWHHLSLPSNAGKLQKEGACVQASSATAYRATQALVLMLKEAMVPLKRGFVSKSQTFMLAQASHFAFPFSSKPLKPSPVKMHTPS